LALRHEKPFDGNFDDEFMKDCLVKSRRFGTSPLKIRLVNTPSFQGSR
jgi:hypothetical protein